MLLIFLQHFISLYAGFQVESYSDMCFSGTRVAGEYHVLCRGDKIQLLQQRQSLPSAQWQLVTFKIGKIHFGRESRIVCNMFS